MSIVIKDLRLKFPDAKERLFTDLSLDIKTHEKVLLVGPSGSGKSTLINVMGKLIPNTIEIPMKATEITSSKGAYVFQDPDSQFTMPTVKEELAFVLENQNIPRKEMDQMFEQVLQTVGLNIESSQPINTLSGGMKQKLAIASALLQDADTLYLDEPTSMLDSESALHLWQTIVNVWRDKTVVIVEHRVEYIWDIVDRVILMNDKGEIVYTGDAATCLKEYRELLDAFGVWHPLSWENAPEFKREEKTGEIILQLHDLEINRGKKEILSVPKLNVSKGEWITLEGENGSGKTSLLLAIMKLIKSQGDIIFLDKKINKTKEYKGKVFPVFQNPELQFMTNSVIEEVQINYELSEKNEVAKEKAMSLLKMFGIEHLQELHPLEISTGQKRRLSVATAMSKVPKVLLFDEPTFGLDQVSTFNLLKIFNTLVNNGVTIIMITHDENIKKRYPSRRLIIDSRLLTIHGDNYV